MKSICHDTVYFYTDTDTKTVDRLWTDLQESITFTPDNHSTKIANLIQHANINPNKQPPHGNIRFMSKSGMANENDILLMIDTTEPSLYETYRAIAKAYKLQFVMRSINPTTHVYINTDTCGRYLHERYLASITDYNMIDHNMITPTGIHISQMLEWDEMFATEASLLKRFTKMGYHANTIDELNNQLENTGIKVYRFKNTYEPNDSGYTSIFDETKQETYYISIYLAVEFDDGTTVMCHGETTHNHMPKHLVQDIGTTITKQYADMGRNAIKSYLVTKEQYECFYDEHADCTCRACQIDKTGQIVILP